MPDPACAHTQDAKARKVTAANPCFCSLSSQPFCFISIPAPLFCIHKSSRRPKNNDQQSRHAALFFGQAQRHGPGQQQQKFGIKQNEQQRDKGKADGKPAGYGRKDIKPAGVSVVFNRLLRRPNSLKLRYAANFKAAALIIRAVVKKSKNKNKRASCFP